MSLNKINRKTSRAPNSSDVYASQTLLQSPPDEIVQTEQANSSTCMHPRPEVSMSWDGVEPGLTLDVRETIPEELPPDYSEVRAPTATVVYTFSPSGSNCMLLVPPPIAPDTRPLYHISVAFDPFIPTVGVTTVRRDSGENGDFVGDFEWGLMTIPATVSVGSIQAEARSVMKQVSSKHSGHKVEFVWTWNQDLNQRLYWIANGHVAKCYLYKRMRPDPTKDEPIAVFSGRGPVTGQRPQRTLEVHPQAHNNSILDQIILGALMIERKRLSPWHDPSGEFSSGRLEKVKAGRAAQSDYAWPVADEGSFLHHL